MTVSNQQVRVSYLGDGTSTLFPIPYPFYLNTDIAVYLGSAPQTVGYSVTGGEDANGNPQTGNVIFQSAPASSVAVQFVLSVPLTQLVKLVDGTSFPSSTLNQVNDRAVQALLRMNDRFSRVISAPDGDVSPSLALPVAVSRANTYLAFDNAGNLSVAQSVPSGTLSRSSIGQFLYPQTAAESAAGVTPIFSFYPPGNIWRYGAVGDGVTNDTQALLAAASIDYPIYIPYTPHGYVIKSTITFNQNVTCDGILIATQIVSQSGQPPGSYTATNPAVIIGATKSLVIRGLFVEGDANAKLINRTIAIRVDGNGHRFFNCGASQCGWGVVIRGFILQFINCNFAFNGTNVSAYGADNSTPINSIAFLGGNYGGGTDFSLNLGDVRFATAITGGNPQGLGITMLGFNVDGAPLRADNVFGLTVDTIYFEYNPAPGVSGLVLGGSGPNYLSNVIVRNCTFSNMKYAILCQQSIRALQVEPCVYSAVTVCALWLNDMTQGANYRSGTSAGSFGNGQEVRVAFPGQNVTTVDFGGVTLTQDGVYNGIQDSIDPITKWYPGASQRTASGRIINTSSLRGVYYTNPAVSKGGTLFGNALTMTTKSDTNLFNGGDRLTGTGTASGVAICLGCDYDAGIVYLDTSGSGAATISQVTVTTATAA